ncbi:YbhB/YbcL family Raf kinase inhibitor-like protein [Loigolactobacillus iwatensis]|uniref:YbhB/YbcL family Raf kinase inhibitor-like protein n=1 Tax=Loigolactobacillus iwatensis TaxID=1267156 RepID=UPI000F7E795A|nr:YbhB/YbcL family Raf kinase inhibitor-like protein [Loigolactobacillus iwatensis]
MKITVPTENGYLADRYSKHATEKEYYNKNPFISFPVQVTDLPTGTKTWALTLLDFDAVSVSGFPWIHWIAANIPATELQLTENASREQTDNFIQGKNSLASPFIGEKDPLSSEHYIGPTPPDKDHDYQLTVYALDQQLELKSGYWLNNFLHQSKAHTLATEQLVLKGRV